MASAAYPQRHRVWNIVKIAGGGVKEAAGRMGGNGSVGPSLKDLRREAGLSVQQVTAVGMSPEIYIGLERGQRLSQLPPGVVMRLAVIFGVSEPEVLAALKVSCDQLPQA